MPALVLLQPVRLDLQQGADPFHATPSGNPPQGLAPRASRMSTQSPSVPRGGETVHDPFASGRAGPTSARRPEAGSKVLATYFLSASSRRAVTGRARGR